MAKRRKIHGEFIDFRFINKRRAIALGMGYPIPQYLNFCEAMLKEEYKVKVHEAYETHSKYITVCGGYDLEFKVRFSNHKPIKQRELNEDCNYFVGITHTGTRTTAMAIEAAKEYFCAV